MTASVIRSADQNRTLGRRSGDVIYLSGCDSVRRDQGEMLASGNAEEQCSVCLANLIDVLVRGGLTADHVVQVTVYLTHMDDLAVLERHWRELFTHLEPARTVVGVAELPGGSRFQVDAVAEMPHRRGTGL